MDTLTNLCAVGSDDIQELLWERQKKKKTMRTSLLGYCIAVTVVGFYLAYSSVAFHNPYHQMPAIALGGFDQVIEQNQQVFNSIIQKKQRDGDDDDKSNRKGQPKRIQVKVQAQKEDGSLAGSASFLSMSFTPADASKKEERYPIKVLPDKVFTVVGLESSGTTFFSETIRNALRLPMIGSKNYYEVVGEGFTKRYLPQRNNDNSQDEESQEYWTEVQHVSLPWGGLTCRTDPRESVVPVLFPAICTRMMRDRTRIQHALNDKRQNGNYRRSSSKATSLKDDKGPFEPGHVRSKKILDAYHIPEEDQMTYLDQCKQYISEQEWEYPYRYSLNITSHIEWYNSQGVDMHVIIVMRDATISRRARQEHCTNSTVMALEEELGMEILQEAIQQYILPQPKKTMRGGLRRLLQASGDGKVLLLSYELLMKLKGNYLAMVYDALGIDSDYMPRWKDGNAKHVRSDPISNGKQKK